MYVCRKLSQDVKDKDKTSMADLEESASYARQQEGTTRAMLKVSVRNTVRTA